jgi:ribosomal protein L44E
VSDFVFILGLLFFAALYYLIPMAWRTRCPNCKQWFAVEVADERIKNKRRRFTGYQSQMVNGKLRTRQRRVTTEYVMQDCVCTECGHEFQREVRNSYDS